MINDKLGVDLELVEDGHGHEASFGVGELAVEVVRVAQDGEGVREGLTSDVEIVAQGCLFGCDGASLGARLGQAALELVLGPVGVAEQIEVALLLGVELRQATAEVLLELGLRGLLVARGCLGLRYQLRAKLVGQPHTVVVAHEFAFERCGRDVGLLAPGLRPDAEEVLVLVAHVDVDHAVATARAEEQPLEVVLVLTRAHPGPGVAVEHALDLVEQIRRDERAMASGIPLVFVVGLTDIEPVPQDACHLTALDRCLGPRRRGAHRKTTGTHDVGEGVDGVFAGGVQLEGFDDKRGALFIDGDRADLATLRGVADVQIADAGTAQRTTLVDDLAAHLVLDVVAGGVGLVLIEDGNHAVHGAAGRGVIEIAFGGRQQGDPKLFEPNHEDGVVVGVASKATQGVDDDVLDVGVLAQVGEHGLKLHTLVGRAAGASRVDKLRLVEVGRSHLIGALLTGHPLGADGDALRVVIGLDLPGA